MANIRVLQRSFSGGEVSPEMLGRIDDVKYQSGLATCRNFIVKPQGPAENRPGTKFVREVKNSVKQVRLLSFTYSITQTMIIEMGEGYFRFHSQGAPLLQGTPSAYVPSATVTISIAAPGVVTWTNHGLPAGTPVQFSTTGALPTGLTAGAIYYVLAPTTNTFTLATSPGGGAITTSGTQSGTHTGNRYYGRGELVSSGGVNYYCILNSSGNTPPNATYWYAEPATGEYEIPNPYTVTDLFDIHDVQSSDVMTLVHPNYPPMELSRLGATDWTLTPISMAPRVAPPGAVITSGSAAAYNYVVTAVTDWTAIGAQLVESLPSAAASCTNDLTVVGAYNTITWSPVLLATSYRVYRQVNGTYYYIGSAQATSFVDNSNITVGTRQPPTSSNSSLTPTGVTATATTPSQTGVTATATTNGATNLTTQSYVVTAYSDTLKSESVATSPASCTNNLAAAGTYNTIAWPGIARADYYNVYKLQGGIYGYIGISKTLSFVDNNIAPDMSKTPPIYTDPFVNSGDYPGAVSYFDQRRVFAGTINNPQSIWMTKSGTESQMSYSLPIKDDDRIYFRVAAREANAIRHVVPLTQLVILTSAAEWRVTSVNSDALTPATISVRPQSYIGASNVQPVIINNTLVYAAARGGHVREMAYSWQANGFVTGDLSLRAAHLFDNLNIVDMAYSKAPQPVIWFISSNGELLGLTYVPEQQIGGWHRHDTDGLFESCAVISEGNEDYLYLVVKRTINGATKRYIERLESRQYATQSDAYFVDCGSSYYKSGTFTRSGTTMTCTITSHGFTNGQTYTFYFSDTSFGDQLTGGTAYVVTVVDANTFTITVANAGATSGAVTQLVTSLSGLTWLEGKTVSILGDGAVMPQAVVTGGAITLQNAAAKIQVGLPITADLQTLPIATQIDGGFGQGRYKNVNKLWLRVYSSGGIFAGPDANNLVENKQRTTEMYGTAPALKTQEIMLVLTPSWADSGQVFVRQSDPLPLNIVSMTAEISIGA